MYHLISVIIPKLFLCVNEIRSADSKDVLEKTEGQVWQDSIRQGRKETCVYDDWALALRVVKTEVSPVQNWAVKCGEILRISRLDGASTKVKINIVAGVLYSQ